MMALSRVAALRSSPMVRHLSVSAPAASKAVDPIQKLFLDKLKEYDTKKQSGKVEVSPELQKELKTELDRVARIYGGAEGVDMTKFPAFTFPEPKVDPINLQ